jgi:hypothetical protein
VYNVDNAWSSGDSKVQSAVKLLFPNYDYEPHSALYNALKTIQNSKYFTDRHLDANGEVTGTYDWAKIIDSKIVSRDSLVNLIGEESVKQLEVYNKIKDSFVNDTITPYALSKLMKNGTVTSDELRESGLFNVEGQTITSKDFWKSAWQKYIDTQKEINAGALSVITLGKLGGNPVTETYNKEEYTKPTSIVDIAEKYVGKAPPLQEYIQNYREENPYNGIIDTNIWSTSPERRKYDRWLKESDVNAQKSYEKEYGTGTYYKEIGILMGSSVLSPVRVLEPTVELKDISGAEWAMTGVQTALVVVPFASSLAKTGWAKFGKIGTNLTEAENAAKILGEAQKELRIATELKTGNALEIPEVANRVQVAEQAVKMARTDFSNAIKNLKQINSNELIRIKRLSGIDISSDLKSLTNNYSKLEKLYSKLETTKPRSSAYAKLQNEIERVRQSYLGKLNVLAEKLEPTFVQTQRAISGTIKQATFFEQSPQNILSEPFIKGQYAVEWYKTIPGAGIFRTGIYAAPGDLESILTGKASRFKASGEAGEYQQFIQAQPTKYLSKDINIRGEGSVLGSEVPEYIKGYISPAYGETFGERLSLTQPQRYKFNLKYTPEDYRGSGGSRKPTIPKTSPSGNLTYIDVKTGKLVSIESPSSVGTLGESSPSWELTKPFDPTVQLDAEFVRYRLDPRTGLLVPEYTSMPYRKLPETLPLVNPEILPDITKTPVIVNPEITPLLDINTITGINLGTISKNEVDTRSSIDTSAKFSVKPKTEIASNIKIVIPTDITTKISNKNIDLEINPPSPPYTDITVPFTLPRLPRFGVAGSGGSGSKKDDYNSFLLSKFTIPEMYVALPSFSLDLGEGITTVPNPLSVSFPKRKKTIEEEPEIFGDDFEQTPFGKRTIVKIIPKSQLKSGARIIDRSRPSIRKESSNIQDKKIPSVMGSLGL